MRSTRIRPLLAVVATVLVLVVSACGGEPVATPADPTLARGQEIYNRQCATCHGLSGGGGQAPRLAGTVVERFSNIDDQIALVAAGVPGTNMRGFADRLDPDELEAVVRYTREGFGD